jgi:hypothetical protein
MYSKSDISKPRIIQQMDKPSSRNFCPSQPVHQVKDGGREWAGRFVGQTQAESRGGRGRACELGVEGGR